MSCWCILIYLNLEKQQSNQAIINSHFIRGLYVCLLHMDEPRGHTVPLKRHLWKVRAECAPLQALELLPPPHLTGTRFLWGKKGKVNEASSPILLGASRSAPNLSHRHLFLHPQVPSALPSTCCGLGSLQGPLACL